METEVIAVVITTRYINQPDGIHRPCGDDETSSLSPLGASSSAHLDEARKRFNDAVNELHQFLQSLDERASR